MADVSSRLITIRSSLLLVLSYAAGYIDALSYLELGRVFTANMTGNTVLLGIAVAQVDNHATIRASFSLVGFLVGAIIGTWIVERDQSKSVWPLAVTFALALEWIILLVFAVGRQLASGALPTLAATAILIVFSALAMGIQSAAIHRLGISGIATTYITGTLTNLIVQLMGRACWRSMPTFQKSGRHLPPVHGIALLAAVWIVYLGGAGVAAVGLLFNQTLASVLPMAFIMFVVIIAAIAFWRQ
jgi:uncharacterized membrane protein YoaK (UPF0700 family)